MNLVTGNENESEDSKLNAVINFYKAFNSGDLTLMEKNWSQDKDIIMSNPLGGFKKGWQEISSVYNNIFNGPAKVYVEFYDFTMFSTDQMFAIVGKERGRFEVDNHRIDLAIRTSRVYQNVNSPWKQIHHHGSIDNPELLENYQTAVLNSK